MVTRYDTNTIRIMNLFENLTGAPVRDCVVEEDTVYVVVEEGCIAMAIGKNGNNVKNAEELIGKSIKVFEFSSSLEKFLKNLIPQALKIIVREEEGKKIVEVRVDKTERPIVIGREGKNLKIFKELLKRNHKVDDLIIR